MAKHIKFVHFNIREFFCPVCEAGFGSKGHLSAHLLTHQGDTQKTYVCQFCSLAFHTRAKLDRHLKSHTGERNYEVSLLNCYVLCNNILFKFLFPVWTVWKKILVQLQRHSSC